jgi:hypothetical protein
MITKRLTAHQSAETFGSLAGGAGCRFSGCHYIDNMLSICGAGENASVLIEKVGS